MTNMMVIEGILISQLYMDELLMSVVLPFAVPESVVKDDNAKIHLVRICKLYQNKDLCIDWPLRSSDMSTVEHV